MSLLPEQLCCTALVDECTLVALHGLLSSRCADLYFPLQIEKGLRDPTVELKKKGVAVSDVDGVQAMYEKIYNECKAVGGFRNVDKPKLRKPDASGFLTHVK